MLRSVVVLVALVGSLSGCFPIFSIATSYQEGSRQNLGEQKVWLIQCSVSTRADVLLALGEPDGIGVDERCLAYGAAHQRGHWDCSHGPG